MKTNDLYFAGLGVYYPDTLVTVADAIAQGLCGPETADVGWTAVHIAGDTPAPDMAISAANLALERSGHAPEDIDLILYSCAHHQGPEGWCPPQYVQRHTVGRDILAIGLSHGCNGMMTSIELAANLLAADPTRTAVLLCTGDNFGTSLFDRWRSHQAVAFADLGSAVVVSRRPGFARLLSVCSSTRPELEELSRGTEPIFPPGGTLGRPLNFEARLASYEGDLLQLAGQLIPDLYGGVVNRALDEAGVKRADITRVTHQATGGGHLLKMAFEPLGFAVEQGVVRWGQEHGRSGASDQVASLDYLLSRHELDPGDHVLLLGNGPGLIVTCAVIEIVDQPPWVS